MNEKLRAKMFPRVPDHCAHVVDWFTMITDRHNRAEGVTAKTRIALRLAVSYHLRSLDRAA